MSNTTTTKTPLKKATEKEKEKEKESYQHDKEIISYVLKNYANRDEDEHYDLYNDIVYDDSSIIPKRKFREIRKAIIDDMAKKRFRAENVRLEYHVNEKLVDYHLDSLELLTKQIKWYEKKWIEETNTKPLNMFSLTKLTRILNDLIVLRGQYNLGTPVVMFLLNKMTNQIAGGMGDTVTDLDNRASGQIMSIADFNKLYANSNLVTKSDESTSSNTESGDADQITDQAGGFDDEVSRTGKGTDTEHSGTGVSPKGSIDIQTGEDDRRKEEVF